MNLWDKILQHTERRVNHQSFATWFRPTRQERAEDGRLVVRVPTRLFCKRLTETYGQLLQAVLSEIGKPDLILEFICTEEEPAVANAGIRPRSPLDLLTTSTTLAAPICGTKGGVKPK